MQPYHQQASELNELRDKVRTQGVRHGWDPSGEHATTASEASMPGSVVNRLWSALNEAARSIVRLAESNKRLEQRNSQLGQSNGALMNDRARGINEANERAQAAVVWAAELAQEHGIPQGEWPDRARDLLAAHWATQARLEREVERLERLRVGVVVPLIGMCEETSTGFTPEQVRILARKLKRANRDAMGR